MLGNTGPWNPDGVKGNENPPALEQLARRATLLCANAFLFILLGT